MAKPAGYIEASDGGLAVIDVSTLQYVDISARLPVQPSEWTDDANMPRYRIETWRQITLDALTDTTEIWNGWPSSSSSDTVAGARAAAWIQYDATGQDPAKPVGSELTQATFTSSETEPRQASYASAAEAHLTFEADVAEGEILAIYLETTVDNAFNTSDPSSTLDYETIGRNTGVWTPYDKNESVSAWLMQRILAQNLNKILYMTKQAWTVPL
jgi:hypothetical protein